ncbi:unnamed protein product [Boreogadus saida]
MKNKWTYVAGNGSPSGTERSGSAARTGKKWKFFAVLSFLDPFVTPRETSSNLPRCAEVEIEDDGAAETSGTTERDEEEESQWGTMWEHPDTGGHPPGPDGQLCADAQLLNSLLPSLKRLPPDTKEYVKFQIHKVLFDATQFTLNLEPV